MCILWRWIWLIFPTPWSRAILLLPLSLKQLSPMSAVFSVVMSNGYKAFPILFSYWHLMKVTDLLFLEHTFCWIFRSPVFLSAFSYLLWSFLFLCLKFVHSRFCLFFFFLRISCSIHSPSVKLSNLMVLISIVVTPKFYLQSRICLIL